MQVVNAKSISDLAVAVEQGMIHAEDAVHEVSIRQHNT
jgi:hypothetical protein